jgi:hypothetical protein
MYSVNKRMKWLAVTVAFLLAACGSPFDSSADGDALDMIRVHPRFTGSGMAAIVSGVVEVDLDSRCVWLTDPGGGRYPIIWPVGTTASDDPFTIVISDGAEVVEGDRVTGGGGYVPADFVAELVEPFPDGCVQTGDVAQFNSDSDIEVEKGVGLEEPTTLVGRFSLPEPIGLELISINPNARSVGVTEFVEGTIKVFGPDDYEGPTNAISGASGGGGFIHVWANGTVYSYPGRIDDSPVTFEPDPLRRVDGAAPTLEVVQAIDEERAWLVQDGAAVEPTLIELVNLVGMQVARLGSWELEGSWQPVGSTIDGLVLNSNEGDPRVLLVGFDRTPNNEVSGVALSVGWQSIAIVQEDATLVVTDASLGSPVEVALPEPGVWTSAGGPIIPAEAPPVVTGGEQLLVALVDAENEGTLLVVVGSNGVARSVYQVSDDQFVASWSRAGDWIVVVEPDGVTLVPIDGGDPVDLGDIVPTDHWVISIG